MAQLLIIFGDIENDIAEYVGLYIHVPCYAGYANLTA